ncbi:MAG: hypothetical protein ACRDLF_02585 [Solirubrobacteraceae bacterium]
MPSTLEEIPGAKAIRGAAVATHGDMGVVDSINFDFLSVDQKTLASMRNPAFNHREGR